MMNKTILMESTNNEKIESVRALEVAFQTMKERCQKLQNRLTTVEKENSALRLKSYNQITVPSTDNKSVELETIQKLQAKNDELVKQKSQLSHQLIMVAAENRQLWNRLTQLTQGNRSYTTSGNKEQSLEEISLKLKNSIFNEKTELEQQYAEMMELQNSSPLNTHYGFTYPENNLDTISNSKLFESRLARSQEALYIQHEKLKKILKCFERIKKGKTCNRCTKTRSTKVCQVGTQAMVKEVSRDNHFTQTSLSHLQPDERMESVPTEEGGEISICPLCGEQFDQIPFAKFNEHVLSHFGS